MQDEPEVPVLKLQTPPPALDPLTFADLIRKATEGLGESGIPPDNAVVTNLRVVKTGWEAQAAVQVNAWGGHLGVGVEAEQQWGGEVDLMGRVNWTRRW